MNFVRSKSHKGINYYSINTISHKVSNLPNLGRIISLRSLSTRTAALALEFPEIGLVYSAASFQCAGLPWDSCVPVFSFTHADDMGET